MKVFFYVLLMLALPMIALAQPIVTVVDEVQSNDMSCPPLNLGNCAQARFTVPVTGDYALDSWLKCPDGDPCQYCVSCAVITSEPSPVIPIVCSAGCSNPCQRTCIVRLAAGVRYTLNVCFQGCPTGPATCSLRCKAVACVRSVMTTPCYP